MTRIANNNSGTGDIVSRDPAIAWAAFDSLSPTLKRMLNQAFMNVDPVAVLKVYQEHGEEVAIQRVALNDLRNADPAILKIMYKR